MMMTKIVERHSHYATVLNSLCQSFAESFKAEKLVLLYNLPAGFSYQKCIVFFQAYIIKVQRGHGSEDTWTLSRRYSDFVALDNELKHSGISLPLPPKKVFGNTSREFIAERQQKLQVSQRSILKYFLLFFVDAMFNLSLPCQAFINVFQAKVLLQPRFSQTSAELSSTHSITISRLSLSSSCHTDPPQASNYEMSLLSIELYLQ